MDGGSLPRRQNEILSYPRHSEHGCRLSMWKNTQSQIVNLCQLVPNPMWVAIPENVLSLDIDISAIIIMLHFVAGREELVSLKARAVNRVEQTFRPKTRRCYKL